MPDGTSLGERTQEQANLKEATKCIRLFAIHHSKRDGEFFIQENYIAFLHLIITRNLPNLVRRPGHYRNIELEPLGEHQPPPSEEVPHFMEDFIEKLNGKWKKSNIAEIAAYALWRLNWIHPFENGNGRTSRLLSYLLINMKSGLKPLPGKEGDLVPELLDGECRKEYENVLSEGDKGNLQDAEKLIGKLIKRQLLSVG